jgi:hypothetical protein
MTEKGTKQDVDGRDEPGHDDVMLARLRLG